MPREYVFTLAPMVDLEVHVYPSIDRVSTVVRTHHRTTCSRTGNPDIFSLTITHSRAPVDDVEAARWAFDAAFYSLAHEAVERFRVAGEPDPIWDPHAPKNRRNGGPPRAQPLMWPNRRKKKAKRRG